MVCEIKKKKKYINNYVINVQDSIPRSPIEDYVTGSGDIQNFFHHGSPGSPHLVCYINKI